MARQGAQCVRCGHPIGNDDFKRGIVTPHGVICAPCAVAMTPEERAEAIKSKRSAVRGGAHAREDGQGPGGVSGAVIAGAVAGVLLLGGVGYFLTRAPAQAKKPKPAPVANVTPKPEPKKDSVDEVRARSQLTQLNIAFQASQRPHDELVRDLKQYIEDFTGKSDAGVKKARELLARVQVAYSAAARENYQKAAADAQQLEEAGLMLEALDVLSAFESRFLSSDWLAGEGRQKLDTDVNRIRAARLAAIEAALKEADRDVKENRFGHALQILADETTKTWPAPLRAKADILTAKARGGEVSAINDPGFAETREKAWSIFYRDLFAAGARSAAGAASLLNESKPSLTFVSADADRLKRLEGVVSDALTAEKAIAEGLGSSRKIMRFDFKGAPVSGRLIRIEPTAVTVRTNTGDTAIMSFSQLHPTQLFEAAELLHARSAITDAQIAAYYLLRSRPQTALAYLKKTERNGAPDVRTEFERTLALIGPSVPAENDFVPEVDPKEVARLQALEEKKAATMLPKSAVPGETGAPGQWSPGLLMELFADEKLTDRRAMRIDPDILFELGAAGIAPEPEGQYAVCWSGWILIPFDGNYSFRVDGGKECSLELGSRKIADQKTRLTKPIKLFPGLYPVKVTMVSAEGRLRAKLQWHVPGASMMPVPPERFFHPVPEGRTRMPANVLARGMWVEYYAGESFEKKVGEEMTRSPSFDWGAGSPRGDCPADGFSVRISGQILVVGADRSTFAVESDGPYRVSVDGEPLIDRWDAGGGRQNLRKAFEPGYHDLLVEYAHKKGDSRFSLLAALPPGHSARPSEFPPDALWHASQVVGRAVDREGYVPGLSGQVIGKAGIVQSCESAASFDWGTNMPAPGVSASQFSSSWKGSLLVPEEGTYVFRVTASGAAELSIGGRVLVALDDKGTSEKEISLADPNVEFALTYASKGGSNALDVQWRGPQFGFRPLGSASLVSAGTVRLALLSATVDIAMEGKRVNPQLESEDESRARRELEQELDRKDVKIANGSFETVREDTNMPTGWAFYKGTGLGNSYARIDRTSPHTGDIAVVVRATNEDARPGIVTTTQLPPGTYELRYYACTEFDKTAQVYSHVAGRDLTLRRVDEDYREIVETVVVYERTANASVRLGIVNAGVRVYFDDVTIKAVGPPPALPTRNE
jgi:hypothetical protein